MQNEINFTDFVFTEAKIRNIANDIFSIIFINNLHNKT